MYETALPGGLWAHWYVRRRRPEAAGAGRGVACEVRQRTGVGIRGECVEHRLRGWSRVLELAVPREVERACLGPGDRPARPRALEAGHGMARLEAARTVVEQHADRRQRLEGGQRPLVRRLRLDRVVRQRHARDAHRLLIDHRSGGLDQRRVGDRRLLGHVELEEVVPAVEVLRRQRVDVRPVGEREPLAVRPGELAGERRAVAAGLLVGPLAGHERRHLDLVHERDRRERVGHLGHVVVVGTNLRHQVDGLRMQRLVRRAGRIALLDALVGPGLTLGAEAALASWIRSCAHATAKPVLRMPPG